MDTPITAKEESFTMLESNADVSQDNVSDHHIVLREIKQERVTDESFIKDIETELLCQESTFEDNPEYINVEVKPPTIEEVIVKNEILDRDSDNRNISTTSNIQSNVEKQFECHICKYHGLTKPRLIQHIEIHTGKKPYERKICNKKFLANGSHRHQIRTHARKKPYSCNTCGKRFSTNSTCQGHMNVHTGEKPFECDLCKKKFSVRDSRSIHMKGNAGKKLFQSVSAKKSDGNGEKLDSSLKEEVYLKSEMDSELFAEDVSDGDPIMIDIKQETSSVELKPEGARVTSKRNHTTLTLNVKAQIVKELKNGVSGKELAKKYGIGTSTISDIKKKQKKIESFIANGNSGCAARKTLRNAEYPEMEGKLYYWFLLQSNRHVPVPYEILAQKAKYFFNKCYGNDNFRASSGWVRNFKKRHGLQASKVCSKKLSNDASMEEPFEKRSAENNRNLDVVPRIVSQKEVSQSISVKTKDITNDDLEEEEEIKEWVDEHEVQPLKDEQKEDLEENKQQITTTTKHDAAVHGFNICLQWAEENDVPLNQILILKNLKEKAFLLSQKR